MATWHPAPVLSLDCRLVGCSTRLRGVRVRCCGLRLPGRWGSPCMRLQSSLGFNQSFFEQQATHPEWATLAFGPGMCYTAMRGRGCYCSLFRQIVSGVRYNAWFLHTQEGRQVRLLTGIFGGANGSTGVIADARYVSTRASVRARCG